MANVYQNFNSHASKIYVFKVVDIDCCEECPKRLKKALGKLHGIESVEVDATQSLATVKGLIDSTEIIKTIKRWGKKAELVHEGKETNHHGYSGELNDEDEEGEKEDLFNASSRPKDFSSRKKDSSLRHKIFFFRKRDKNKSSSHAPEKHVNSKSNVPSPKEIPDHICRDKYCTFHRRDDSTTSDDRVPNMNYGPSYSPFYRGGGNNNYPRMNSYVPSPSMYGPPPHQYGQYYGPRMFPPMAGHGSYATQRPMAGYGSYATQRPMAGYGSYATQMPMPMHGYTNY